MEKFDLPPIIIPRIADPCEGKSFEAFTEKLNAEFRIVNNDFSSVFLP